MTRSVNRRKWDKAELERRICDRESDAGAVFAHYRDLLALRRLQPAFHPDAAQHILDIHDSVLCFERIAPDAGQRILIVANLSSRTVDLDRGRLPADLMQRKDLLQINRPEIGTEVLPLEPYAVFWFSRHY